MNDVIRIVGAIGVFAGLIYWLFCRAKRRESARQVAAMSHKDRQAWMNAAARQVLDRCNAKRAHYPRRLDVRTWAQTHGSAAHFTPDGADAFAYMAAKSADDTPSRRARLMAVWPGCADHHVPRGVRRGEPGAGECGHAQMTNYGQLTAQQIRYWAKEARDKLGLDMIYAETQEEADALNALYKPEKPYVTGVVYYAEPIDGVEHKPALSKFWEPTRLSDFISPDALFPGMTPKVFSFAASKMLPHRVGGVKVGFGEAMLRLYGIDPREMSEWCCEVSAKAAKSPD